MTLKIYKVEYSFSAGYNRISPESRSSIVYSSLKINKIKKLYTVLASIVFVHTGCAQQLKESDIPVAVKTKFTSIYTDAKNIKWEKEDGKYEAEFKQNKTEIAVLLDTAGSLVQTETAIDVSTLPQGVLDYVSKNLSGKNIKEAAKIVDAGGTVTYEAEVQGTDYLFDANGNFIKIETDDPDDKEDND